MSTTLSGYLSSGALSLRHIVLALNRAAILIAGHVCAYVPIGVHVFSYDSMLRSFVYMWW